MYPYRISLNYIDDFCKWRKDNILLCQFYSLFVSLNRKKLIAPKHAGITPDDEKEILACTGVDFLAWHSH